MARKQAPQQHERKAQLIAAALDSIAKRGLSETTITHIARGAKMSRGIINFYFTSKEMLLREALKTLLDRYQLEWQGVRARYSDDGYVRLAALVCAHFGKTLCAPQRLRMMTAFWGHAASHVAYRHQLEQADAAIERAFAEAFAQALHGPLEEATQHATQLHALLRGLWLRYLMDPTDAQRELLAAEAMRFLELVMGAPVRIVPTQMPLSAPLQPAPKRHKPTPREALPMQDLFALVKDADAEKKPRG